MKKNKIKAAAYSINLFVLGLTGSWIIPVDFYKPVSIVTAIILLVMFLTDLKGSFPKDKSEKKVKTAKPRRRKPPRSRRRRKRK
ncbi:hypothetical protein ACI77O_13135 [Pseudomonas tritici]|uniref:hypothetical protein n=1 Tax=Pseudomonas tritici TaxID=2745518 RepID=UPI00387B3F00